MVLFSSVDTLRTSGSAKIWGGDLRLFFSTQEDGDLTPAPPPGAWKPGSAAKQKITAPTGDVLEIQLRLVIDPPPGTLYLFPNIQITDPQQGQIFPQPGIAPTQVGQPIPGTPAYVSWNGRINAINHAFIGEAGFQMVVPFNGVSADCYGRWWAIWNPAS
jgi:hypothetical protein